MKPAIFKAYDIRGLYPEELDARGALAIGRAFARKLGPGAVAVGFDMRTSAAALREAFVTGLRAEGADVIEIGRVSTPILYFATTRLRRGRRRDDHRVAQPWRLQRLQAVRAERRCRSGSSRACARSATPRSRSRVSPRPPRARIAAQRRPEERATTTACSSCSPRVRKLRAVIDAGNGIAGEAYGGLLDRLPLETTKLYFEPDGSFPNHEADPLKLENLRRPAARGARRARGPRHRLRRRRRPRRVRRRDRRADSRGPDDRAVLRGDPRSQAARRGRRRVDALRPALEPDRARDAARARRGADPQPCRSRLHEGRHARARRLLRRRALGPLLLPLPVRLHRRRRAPRR